MKTRKFIIAGSIFLAGAILFFIGFIALEFDINRLSGKSEYHAVSYVQSESVKSIAVNDSNTEVRVVRSQDAQVHVDYSESDITKYEVKYESGELIITKEDTGQWWRYFFFFDFESHSVKVALPEEFQGDLKIATSNSSISVEQVSANSAVFTTSNGSITLRDFFAKNDLLIKTANASIELSNVKSERTVNIKTSNGKITLKNVTSGQEISAETSNAQIEVDAIDVREKLKLVSSNGQISGNIRGDLRDFSIASQTSNGKNNLPENLPDGQKTLSVITSNAKINVEFLGQSLYL